MPSSGTGTKPEPMAALFAFLHHLAAFALVSALVVEFVLLRGELTVATARKIQVYDLVYGASAGLVFLVGVARVLYFEKGADYYLHSIPFIAKLALFLVVGLLSIYPTVTFLSWGKYLRLGQAPALSESRLRSIRAVIHAEMAGVVLILLCAALMAHGIGYAG
jgi:putative membrane protein